jgi:hypothetical protein
VQLTVGTPNAAPTLTALSPPKTTAGGPTFTLTATGTGFVNGATLYFGPNALPTTVTGSTSAQATVNASLIAKGGSNLLTFVNPSPGSASGTLSFNVVLPRPANLSWKSVQAGMGTTCGLTTTNSLYCWGADLARGPDSLYPAAVASGMTFDTIDVGYAACALKSGQVYCWGPNDLGQAGVFSATPAPIFTGTPFRSVSSGRTQSCGITSTGALDCWGSAYGSPGNSTNLLPDVGTAVSSDSDLVCVVGGLTQCWGPQATRFGFLSGNYVAVSASYRSVCALTTTGAAYCWGDNLGADIGCYLGTGTTNTYEPTPKPLAIPGGAALAEIHVGCFANCGLTTTGDVYCWGRNDSGILGNGTTSGAALAPVLVPGLPKMATITVGKDTPYACGVSTIGERWCWGDDSGGELGDGVKGPPVSTPELVP